MTKVNWKTQLALVKQSQQKLSLYGKQALVVGGTSGIGQAMAIRLAAACANVTIVGRNKKIGSNIVEEMKKASLSNADVVEKIPNLSSNPPKFSFIPCDVSLLKNVKITSDLINDSFPKLDYLICTQGIASIDGRSATIEDIDSKLSLHYYSRYAFAYYLQALMNKSVDPRFVSVFSGGMHSIYRQFQQDPDLIHHFTLANMANATGMYNDFACSALSSTNKNISYMHIAPGFISTNWGREMPFFLKPILNFLKRFARDKDDCAEFMCQTIFNPNFKAPGYHILNQYGQPTTTTNYHTPENIQFIWNHTLEHFQKAEQESKNQ